MERGGEGTEMKRVKTMEMEGRKIGNCGVKQAGRRESSGCDGETAERGGGREKKNGGRERRVRERRQGVSFPAEPDSANGQLEALREQFRGPY